MKKYDKAIKNLQALLLSKDLEEIPYVLEDKIAISHFLITPGKHGDYWLIDRQNHTKELFYNKLSAIAMAKNYKSNTSKEQIRSLDKFLSKHSNDCIFYKNIIKKSTNNVRIEATQTRLADSKFYTTTTKQKLYNFILR